MLRENARAPLCLLGAVALHATATLLGSCDERDFVPEARAALNATLLDVAVDAPPGSGGPAPGGGSPVPDPKGAATALPSVPAPPAPKLAARAEKTIERASLREDVAPEPDPDAALDSASDLLTTEEKAVELLPVAAPKLRPVRTFEKLQRPTATSPDAASGAAASRSEGLGPGANEGPGGHGRGWGKGGGGSPFGGASGALRADVCFIPKDTPNLKQLNGECPPVLTLYTNVLDVPPRSFTDGFPGVSDRFEWFAVFYRGKFTVAKSNHYRFRILSDDGSILFIDGYRIIDNDGQHAPQAKHMTIPLEAGEHEIFVQYYQGHRDIIALQLFVRPDGGEERLFTPEL